MPPLASIALQYLLIAGFVYTYRLETAGFLRLLALCGVGLVVHHLLPLKALRFRGVPRRALDDEPLGHA